MLRHFRYVYSYFLEQVKLVSLWLLLITLVSEVSMALSNGQFLARDHLVIDLKSGTEWMRCTVGQRWNGSNCVGEIIRLTQEDASRAVVLANEQLGGSWRLPSRKELEGLVCNECVDVKINSKIFPQTVAEPYWTGEVNGFASRHFWSVNFMTGYTYGRFFPQKELAVRLLRDR